MRDDWKEEGGRAEGEGGLRRHFERWPERGRGMGKGSGASEAVVLCIRGVWFAAPLPKCNSTVSLRRKNQQGKTKEQTVPFGIDYKKCPRIMCVGFPYEARLW